MQNNGERPEIITYYMSQLVMKDPHNVEMIKKLSDINMSTDPADVKYGKIQAMYSDAMNAQVNNKYTGGFTKDTFKFEDEDLDWAQKPVQGWTYRTNP